MCEEVVHETGDMLAARAAGIAFEHKVVSLNDVLTGAAADRPRRGAAADVQVDRAARQDIVVAELVVNKAIASGLAQPTPLGFLMKQT